MATVVNPNDDAYHTFRKFGRILREYREKKGFSQIDLAKRLKIAQSTISAWENGRQLPESPKAFEDFCKRLELNEIQTTEVLDAWHTMKSSARETTVAAAPAIPVLVISQADLELLLQISKILGGDLPRDLAFRIIEVRQDIQKKNQLASLPSTSDSP